MIASMGWVLNRLSEREEKLRRQAKIAAGAEPLWKGLCEALTESLNTYTKETGTKFEKDGANHHLFWTRFTPESGKPEERRPVLSIVLHTEGLLMLAEYTNRQPELHQRAVHLDLDESDNVRFINRTEARLMRGQEVAEYFLDPFLFPDLQP